MMIRKHVPVAVAVTAAVCLAAACGTGDDEGTNQNAAPPSVSGGFPGMPGAFGEIASVSGTTITVTSPMAGEVSVTYTESTELTDQVTASAKALAAGACVQVTAAADDTDTDTDTVVAATVVISQPVDDECATAPGGGDRPPINGTPPAGAPSGMPSGAPGGLGTTMGQVATVGTSGFTITTSAPGSGAAPTVQVSTSATTTWLTTTSATGTALAEGRCVMATGETDDTGTVTATHIAVSDPVDGACAPGGPGR